MIVNDNLRLAFRDDFLDKNGRLICGVKFFVKGYHPETRSYEFPNIGDVPLEEHITKRGMEFIEQWGYWLDDKRIYLNKEIPVSKNIPLNIDSLNDF